MLPTLANVRAVGFLTDGVQIQFAHEVLEARVVRSARSSHFEPFRLALRKWLVSVAALDLVEGCRGQRSKVS
jgi:hypothetical protein